MGIREGQFSLKFGFSSRKIHSSFTLFLLTNPSAGVMLQVESYLFLRRSCTRDDKSLGADADVRVRSAIP